MHKTRESIDEQQKADYFYNLKEKFKTYREDEFICVECLITPRFKAYFINNSCEKVQWIDKNPLDGSNAIKMAEDFYKLHFS